MIDIKLIRSGADKVIQGIKDRGGRYLPALEELTAKDKKYKSLLTETENIRSKHNEISAKIGRAKSGGEKTVLADVSREAEQLKAALKGKEEELSALKKEIDFLSLGLPNIPHPSVIKGLSPEENRVIREDVSGRKQFSFKPLDHQTVGEKLGILDFESAGKISGSRFALLKGSGALLERALVNFMLDIHIKEHGYTEIFPPFLVSAQTMTGTGQLPKFEDDLYKVQGDIPMYLIPTAEVPVTNMHRESVLKENELPFKYCAYTACFRQEAGSYGKDTRGLIRNHQFNKVELVWLTKPEDSMNALEKLTGDAETILRKLNLPYRVLELCSGDLGFASCKTYDLEVWMPGENKFREISSCSNCWDFQSRRMNTRFKRNAGGPPEFVHTLNGSGIAVGRTFAAILENYQNNDGSVMIPEALKPYAGVDAIK